MISELQSVREQNLREIAHPITHEEAMATASFAEPFKLFEIWRKLPGDIPHYSHVKPTLFRPSLLPSMYILDVLPADDDENETGDVDFRFRLFGTANRDNYGKEATGNRLSQSAREGADQGVASGFGLTQQAYHKRVAQFLMCEYYKNQTIIKTVSFVVLPLSDDQGNIVRMFGCGIWMTP
ncbi:PAS domain-containing protein [Kordiimonas aquimaris]|uniref:hypothetical protein n=1 Tax=Kordiimonas aquimaris TaxID=707591 RepID=UPI0021D040E9|nr:hypothetical protein [Kordiimonas aquimaris]